MNSKERFTNRVDAYVKYRPGYPPEAIDYILRCGRLQPESQIADVGAGTGIFTRLLLERGLRVTAVEPNEAMREEAVRELGGLPGFRAVSAAAESTGLPDRSVDLIVCAQAFHWFDPAAARQEFRRILKPSGQAALIWNSRKTSGSAFLEEYERLLLTYGTDYAKVNHRNISPDILAAFFKDGNYKEARFDNRQLFDFDGLRGRLLSSSYTPVRDHPNFEPMMEELRSVFTRNERNGTVSFDYETEVFIGEV